MNEFTISQFANIISIISGAMTILGISGIVTWGLFKREEELLANKIIAVSTYSVKCFLCIILLFTIIIMFKVLYIEFVLLLTGKFIETSWHPFTDLIHSICYITISLFIIPLYVILCLCIYSWSLLPIRKFIKLLKKK